MTDKKLEEAAESWASRYIPATHSSFNITLTTRKAFIAGAKWQAENLDAEALLREGFEAAREIGRGRIVYDIDSPYGASDPGMCGCTFVEGSTTYPTFEDFIKSRIKK